MNNNETIVHISILLFDKFKIIFLKIYKVNNEKKYLYFLHTTN